TLSLQSAGAISQGAGAKLNAASLTGSAGTSIALGGTNSIATLGSLSAGGDMLIANIGTMTLNGPVSAGTSLALVTAGLLEGTGGSLAAGTIAIAPYNAGGLDLGGTGLAGLQLSQALVSAFASGAVIRLGAADGATANSILSEGAVSFANALVALNSTGGLTQTGNLSANNLALTGTSLALNGQINATALSLTASGAINQTGGNGLTLSSLSGSGGSIALTGGANSIASVTGLTAAGGIAINDAGALSVAGGISAGSTIALAAPTLDLGNTLISPHVSLTADTINDAGGAIQAGNGTVDISPLTATRTVDLGGGAAGLDLSGTLLGAISAARLDISTQGGIVADGAASLSTKLLSLSANGISFAGTLSLPGTLALASGAGITSTAGNVLSASLLQQGGQILGDVDLGQGTNNFGMLGSFTLGSGGFAQSSAQTPGSGNFTLADTQPLTITGPISTSGGLVLRSAGAITQASALSGQQVSLTGSTLTLAAPITAGMLALTASNGVSETTGSINATLLTGNISGDATLDAASNSIGTLANFSATGTLRLRDAGALSQAGGLSAGNAILTSNGLNLAGSVLVPGSLLLASTGSVLQSGGAVSTGTLSSLGTVQGDIIMAQPGNLLPVVNDLAATGAIDLTSAAVLAQTGALSAGTVTLNAPSLALNGVLDAGGALQLNGGSASEGGNAAITTALLTTGTGSLSGGAVLNNGANRIDQLGNFTAVGGLAMADGTPLAISAPVALGGTLALWDASSITQTGGSITAAALTSDGGTIGGNARFGQPGNLVPVLGAFAATGLVQLTTGTPLTLSGDITAGQALNLASGGAIGQSGGLVSTPVFNAVASAISLSGTAITQLGNVTASGDVSIANVNELAGTLSAQNATLGAAGGFTSSGTARIGNSLKLTANGAVVQTGGSISAATATISAPSITLSGATDITGALALQASGEILHLAGSLDAGTLSGTAGQLADFTGPGDIATLGSFLMPGGTFLLNDSEALTLLGPLVANVASITASGALTLEGNPAGGLFLSGSTISSTATQPRTGIDSVLVSSDPSIVSTGTFYIDSGPNLAAYLGNASPVAALFMRLGGSGSIALAPTPGLLDAPNTDLVLASGPAGVITGNINVLHLEVVSAASTDMTGSIGSITGPTAAGNGSAFPFPQPGYRFNTCPIGSVNCTILPIAGLPQASPLQNFDLSPRKRKKLDKNVPQPGVAARDF
uniref:beta strand repeat-containing protein n=1 Tax=Acidocella facilis TaxID=525 RepID=UPI00047C9D88